MKIIIESPEKLTDSDLEEVVDMWIRKGRWIPLFFRLLTHYICTLTAHALCHVLINIY